MKKEMPGVVRLKSTVLWSSQDCSKNVGLCFFGNWQSFRDLSTEEEVLVVLLVNLNSPEKG